MTFKKEHWLAKTRFYCIRSGVKRRCENANTQHYNRYWWKFITYCDKWLDFIGFRDDMYEWYLEHIERFWERDTTIDRIDTNWHYCKENCRWATRDEQAKNRWNYKTYSKSGLCIKWRSKLLPENRFIP